MTRERLDQVLGSAIAAGLLSVMAQPAPQQDARRWFAVLLTALSTGPAALPLLGALLQFLGKGMLQGTVAYLVAGGALGLAVTALPRRGPPLFPELLAVPALLVGGRLTGRRLVARLATACSRGRADPGMHWPGSGPPAALDPHVAGGGSASADRHGLRVGALDPGRPSAGRLSKPWCILENE